VNGALRAQIGDVEWIGCMVTLGEDQRRSEALANLRKAVGDLAASTASNRATLDEQERLLSDCQIAIKLAEDLLLELEHNVRGPLTVVKGRAQLLRRRALASPQPNFRLIAGLNEIDASVDRLVIQLDRLLQPRPGDAADSTASPDGA
jgi:nitrogen-specific signal transduction histidine kinase